LISNSRPLEVFMSAFAPGTPPSGDPDSADVYYDDRVYWLTPVNASNVAAFLEGFVGTRRACVIHTSAEGVVTHRLRGARRGSEQSETRFELVKLDDPTGQEAGAAPVVLRLSGVDRRGNPVQIDAWPGTGSTYLISDLSNHAQLTWGMDADGTPPETLLIARRDQGY
jgi:hypothetical protein